MKKRLLVSTISLIFTFYLSAQQTVDLSGQWQFAIDRTDAGIREEWFKLQLSDQINLPASMPEKLKGDRVNASTQWTGSLYDSSFYFNPYMEKFRVEHNFKVPFFLTPDRHYVGVAWYQKEIAIPSAWKGDRILFFMERPHIETTVWVDNKEVGMQNSLCVPHEYDITPFVTTNTCRISVRVDNRIKNIDVGPDSHSITDQTQGNWNGIVGKIDLFTTPKIYFDDIRIYPDLLHREAVVKMRIKSASAAHTPISITLSAQSFNSQQKHTVAPVSHRFDLTQSEQDCEIALSLGEGMLTWDEFDPALYMLRAELSYGKKTEVKHVQFGMREFIIKDKWFYVNGNKTMLRGTVENCTFPLTGYAPTNVRDWERIFRICRDYGLNHMRFHSYCPPEAAFVAADRVGIYLQPEGPSWPNHGTKLGNGQPIDQYLMDETISLTKRYGNYASFCMLASGNEPAGRWVAWVTDFVEYWEKTDPRRVYTGASVGGSWQWQPRNQYHVKAGARGLDWANRRPESLSDYRARIDTVKQPFVSHETGQWCAFPNFNEIHKYTGVNKAKNFEIFKEILEDNNMGHQAHHFLMASGKLQAICYKNEIEKTLRTPGYAGFQLLSLNDYSGQGTALVGLLDVFWEEKGYISAEEMRRFCSPTVLLSRIPKFTYKNNETFEATIEIAHFHKTPIRNANVAYIIKDDFGKVHDQGDVTVTDIPTGNCFELGKVRYNLRDITCPQKLKMEVYINGTDILNHWNFWVYPAEIEINTGGVYTTDTLDEQAKRILEQGGNVLITAAGKISYGKDVVQYLTPVFWNTSWFKMRPPHTTGIWVNTYHPLFKNFPTDYHSDLQWWELLNKSQVMQFTRFDSHFQPLVQCIDTWFISRKTGTLFEAKVLNGKLIMTSMDIISDPDNRFVARQMYKAILDYMNSDDFRPKESVSLQQIDELFTRIAPKVDSFTKDSPDELKPLKGDKGI